MSTLQVHQVTNAPESMDAAGAMRGQCFCASWGDEDLGSSALVSRHAAEARCCSILLQEEPADADDEATPSAWQGLSQTASPFASSPYALCEDPWGVVVVRLVRCRVDRAALPADCQALRASPDVPLERLEARCKWASRRACSARSSGETRRRNLGLALRRGRRPRRMSRSNCSRCQSRCGITTWSSRGSSLCRLHVPGLASDGGAVSAVRAASHPHPGLLWRCQRSLGLPDSGPRGFDRTWCAERRCSASP